MLLCCRMFESLHRPGQWNATRGRSSVSDTSSCSSRAERLRHWRDIPLTISLSKRPCNPMIAPIKKAACAPVEEPRMFTQGHGDDVIATPFDANGRVTFVPVYIYTIRPENSHGGADGRCHLAGRCLTAFCPAHHPKTRSRVLGIVLRDPGLQSI